MRKRMYLEESLNNWLRCWVNGSAVKKKKTKSANNRFSFYLLVVFQCRLDMKVNLSRSQDQRQNLTEII